MILASPERIAAVRVAADAVAPAVLGLTAEIAAVASPTGEEAAKASFVEELFAREGIAAERDELGDVLRTHRGNSEVRLHLQGDTRTEVMGLPVHLRVNPGPSVFGDLKGLLGPACLYG